MKDFGRWLADMADDLAEEDSVTLLPDGVVEAGENGYEAMCRSCGKWCDICCDPADFDPNMHYCGGSPRCCP